MLDTLWHVALRIGAQAPATHLHQDDGESEPHSLPLVLAEGLLHQLQLGSSTLQLEHELLHEILTRLQLQCGKRKGMMQWACRHLLAQAINKNKLISSADHRVTDILETVTAEATYLLTGSRFQQKPIVYQSQQEGSRTGDHEHPACTRCQHHITDLLQRYGNKMAALQVEKEGLAGQLQDSLAAAIFMQNRLESDVQQLETAFALEVSAHRALKDSICKKDEEVQALHIKLSSAQDAQATMQCRLEQEQAQVTALQQARLQDSAECQALKDSSAVSMHQQAEEVRALHVSLAAAQDAQTAMQQRLEEEQARVAMLETGRQQDSLDAQEREGTHQEHVAMLNRQASDAAAKFKEQQKTHEAQVADLQSNLAALQRQAKEAGLEAAAKHEAILAKLWQAEQAGQEAAATLREQQESHQEEIVHLVKQHQKTFSEAAAKLQELQKEHQAVVADMQAKHQAQLAALQRQAKEAGLEAAAKHETILAQLRQAEQAGQEAAATLQEQQELHQEEIVHLVKQHQKACSEETAAKLQGHPVSESSKKSEMGGPPSPDSVRELRSKVSSSSSSSSSSEAGSPRGSHAASRAQELELELSAAYTQLRTVQAELNQLQQCTSIPKLLWNDDWELKERLGKGASGAVYRVDSPCYPNCVLKKGPLDAISEEAEAMRYLNHPNVAKLYAEVMVREHDSEGRDVGCLVLQRLGPSLARYNADPTVSLPLRCVVVGLQGLAAGLAHIHSKGLVDQDVYPGNVLLAADNSTFIKADLGSAVFAQEDGQPNRQFRNRCCVGTEAPELADSMLRHGWYEPNPSSDVWSFGLLMMDMVGAGRPSAHTKLYNDAQYQADLEDGLGPDDSAAVKAYYVYLQHLMPGHGNTTTYARQVKFPQMMSEGPKTCAARQFRHVMEKCLSANPKARPHASQVQSALHKIMKQHGWTSDMTER